MRSTPLAIASLTLLTALTLPWLLPLLAPLIRP